LSQRIHVKEVGEKRKVGKTALDHTNILGQGKAGKKGNSLSYHLLKGAKDWGGFDDASVGRGSAISGRGDDHAKERQWADLQSEKGED